MTNQTTGGICPTEHGGKMQDCAAYPACACDHPTAGGSALAGLGADELVHIEGEDIVIRITPAALKFASENGVLCTFSTHANRFRRATVTNLPAWRAAIVRALRREEENGDTPVHLLLDAALEYAADQGEEGIEIERLLP